MADNTKIEWTNATWNPWHGCIKVSPGCKLCYMYTEKKMYGQDPTKVVRSKTKFDDPLKWKESAMVFTCSWSDFFIEQADEWRPEAWEIIKRTPHLTYQILTKRPERIAEHLPPDWGKGYPNVWLGVSVENQQYADRVCWLLRVPCLIRFVSAEPLLGPIDFTRVDYTEYARLRYAELQSKGHDLGELIASMVPNSMFMNVLNGHWDDGWDSGDDGEHLNWVIVGGESGHGARTMQIQWAESLLDQCATAGVAFFLKQFGAKPETNNLPIIVTKKGGDPQEWPEYLRVRQFPEVRA